MSQKIRIYWENTDASGVVYHSQYLNFAERGRTDYLRHLGFEQESLRHNHDTLFVVSKLSIDYKRPAVLDDEIRLKTSVEDLTKTSLLFDQKLYRGEELLTTLKVKIACLSNDLKIRRLPDFIYERLLKEVS